MFDANNLAMPCQHCSTDPLKAANCIKEYTNNQQTPPPQSNTGGSRMKDYVELYERTYPNATMDDIHSPLEFIGDRGDDATTGSTTDNGTADGS